MPAAGEWGALARDAAERFARDYYDDEDIAVLLLQDIRQVFDARSVDRIFSKDLVEALRAKEDAPWCEWRHSRHLVALAPASRTVRRRGQRGGAIAVTKIVQPCPLSGKPDITADMAIGPLLTQRRPRPH
jgi:hypothetical protein